MAYPDSGLDDCQDAAGHVALRSIPALGRGAGSKRDDGRVEMVEAGRGALQVAALHDEASAAVRHAGAHRAAHREVLALAGRPARQ